MSEGSIRVIFTTKGRKTGKPHSVMLRAVFYNHMVYFSRRNENSDWLKNAIVTPDVLIQFNGKSHSGLSSLVTDESLAKKISELKYPGEQRAQDARIVLQVKLIN